MPVQFDVECGAAGKQVVIIDDDGSLSMPGYDPSYEETLVALSGKEDYSLCYNLHAFWETIIEKMDVDRFGRELYEQRYEEVKRGYWYDSKKREFNFDDLAEFLADMLKDSLKKGDPVAVAIASVIGKLPTSLGMSPDIDVEYIDSDWGWDTGSTRSSTHTLKIGKVEVASWEHRVDRDIYDIFYFDTNVENNDWSIEDAAINDPTREVLKALGIEDPDPDPPEEFDTPKSDDTKEGAYGVMYEHRVYEHGVAREDQEIDSVEVVIYEYERTAKEAWALANRIQRNTGDYEYEITLVRRKAPSERLQDAQHTEDFEEFDPIYMEWTELEEDWHDRPEDFED